MKLVIVIPALDEEDAIDEIIRRSLAAREVITSRSPVDEVEIVVVSDGSTDRTVERASKYTDDIELVVFPVNRGYGAAIKEGWSHSDADLLGFLDADGTCDPAFFADLCTTLAETESDVVLGCRMNPQSSMPLTRKIGNSIFARLLAYLSTSEVRDVASGMRVVRRDRLGELLPLPDGLHFTPAMSARAILSDSLRIAEIDMPYKERTGESKLKVFRDGVRFLKIIGLSAILYRPGRVVGAAAILCAVSSLLFFAGPAIHYAGNRELEDWMIYRCSAGALLATAALLLGSVAYLANRVVDAAISVNESGGIQGRLRTALHRRSFWLLPLLCVVVAVALAWSGLVDYVTTGEVDTHWSRVVAFSTLTTFALILCTTRLMSATISLVRDRLRYLATLRSTTREEANL